MGTAGGNRSTSQPISIPEIPPFRKQFPNSNEMNSSVSPPKKSISPEHRIPEIPPYRPRVSKDYIPEVLDTHIFNHPSLELSVSLF